MPRLIALDLPGGPDFVAAVAEAWDAGDAVFPLDQRLPAAERARVLDAVRPTHVLTATGVDVAPEGVEAEAGDALVIATSGTTGEPKAAVLTRSALEATTAMTAEALEIVETDRWLLCLPVAHVGGFGVVARAVLGGTPIVAQSGFVAAEVEAAGRQGATLVSLVPTVLDRIDPAVFRAILLGGSAIPKERPSNAIATYGMTETAGGVVYDGRPLRGVELRVADDGEVFVRSPSLLRGYRFADAPLDTDGFLPTGDLGSVTDGVLEIHGRKGDVIVTGGQKVWPHRVEAVLGRLAGIEEVRVVGRTDPEWGEIVVAEIVGPNPPALEALRDAVKEELPAYMAPRVVIAVESIPRTALGKVRRS